MKKHNVKVAVMAAALLLGSSALKAQVSHGGAPLYNHSKNTAAVVALPTIDNQRYLMEDAQGVKSGTPLRVGVVQDVNISNMKDGSVSFEADGSLVWRVGISSPNAVFMNLDFSTFDLPQGAELFIYDASGDFVLGKFGAEDVLPEGNFYTQAIPGSMCYIEYREPADVAGKGRLVLRQVVHGYKDLFRTVTDMDMQKGALGDAEGNCHINVACPESEGWENQIRATVAIQLRTSRYSFMCSGTTVNNTNQDRTPFVLTAYHCQDLDQYGGLTSMVFYWKYQNATCSGGSAPTSKAITGFNIMAKYSYDGGSDFCLIKLNRNIPDNYEPYYAGWDRTNVSAPSVGVCIHHPGGDTKKISFPKYINRMTGSYTKFYRVGWFTGAENKGVTEQGSSGSGLFNAEGRVIGQLYAGTSACDEMAGEDLYGRVYASWTGDGTPTGRLSDWLDSANTGITVLDGLDYTDNPVNIHDMEAMPKLNIFPNPSTGMVNIDVEDLGDANYKVFDVAGRCVAEGRTVLTSTVQTLNLGMLNNGSYRLVLYTSAKSYAQTIVISK